MTQLCKMCCCELDSDEIKAGEPFICGLCFGSRVQEVLAEGKFASGLNECGRWREAATRTFVYFLLEDAEKRSRTELKRFKLATEVEIQVLEKVINCLES